MKTLNPIWNTRIVLNINIENTHEAPPVILTLWDYDNHFGVGTDDLIGYC